jgi:hypothetical protein
MKPWREIAVCGVAPPPLDLGRQVGFDRAASLAFSADEQKLSGTLCTGC